MNNNKESKKSTVFILWILFAGSLGMNLFQWLNINHLEEKYGNQVDSLLTARVNVEKELSDTYSELNKYKGISSRLDSLLQEANGKVDEQKSRIEGLMHDEKNNASLNKKLQKEIAELKALREEYMEKIDNLLVENEQLKKDKTDLTSTVETLSKNLESTVNTAAVLKSEYYVVTAYKKRTNNKYAATAIAKRTNKIEACFTLLENSIAKPGMRSVYLRIIEPGGKVLGNSGTGSGSFRKNGSDEDILFSSSIQIDYQNAKQNACLSWENEERIFNPGTYTVEVYVDGTLSGLTSLNLR